MNKLPLAISGLLWCSLMPGYALAAANYEESLKQFAEEVMAESVRAKKERLAIVDFTDSKGTVTPVGQFLAEELGTQILVVGDVAVVERRLVNSTLKKLHIKEIESQSVFSVLNHLAHRRRIRSHHCRTTGQCIDKRPGKNEWHRQIKMQIAD